MPTSPELEREAIEHLQGMENPFEGLACPQEVDDSFSEQHVPEVLQEPRQIVLEMIDAYRAPDYAVTARLRPTRVVTVRGARGSGKTHLLHALAFRQDGRSQLLVRPTYFSLNLPFEEYLLAELRAALVEENPVTGARPIDTLAERLTRRLLLQTVRALSPTDRLFAVSPGRWRRFWLLWGNGHRLARCFDALAEELASPDSRADVRTAAAAHGFSPELCFRLIQGHQGRFGSGRSLLPSLRRDLYEALAAYTLLRREDALASFLESGFGDEDEITVSRLERVAQLLQVFGEVSALAELPIVFAFDNLEGLFSPLHQTDRQLIRGFMRSLAQAVDGTRGLLFLLFAESGMLDAEVQPHMDEFVQHRLHQGVALPRRGPIAILDLKPPAPTEVQQLVETRVQQQLRTFPHAKELPPSFPFGPERLQELCEEAARQTLRITLLRLRDEYAARVCPTGCGLGRTETAVTPRTPTPAVPPPVPDLEAAWTAQLKAADPKLNGDLVGRMAALYAGLEMLLQNALPVRVGDWELQQTTLAPVGSNANYGQVALLDWRRAGGAVAAEDGQTVRVGVGLLLATGTGMRGNLRAHFDLFGTGAPQAAQLIVLWHTTQPDTNLAARLPPATAKVWEDNRRPDRDTLRGVRKDELCMLLAAPEWLNQLRENPEGLSQSQVRDFIGRKCAGLFQRLLPQSPVKG